MAFRPLRFASMLAMGSMALMGAMAMHAAPALGTMLSYNGPGTLQPNGLNIGQQAMVEEAAMANMMGLGANAGSYVKNRRPGERAHRRWRQARAAGRGASRS